MENKRKSQKKNKKKKKKEKVYDYRGRRRDKLGGWD